MPTQLDLFRTGSEPAKQAPLAPPHNGTETSKEAARKVATETAKREQALLEEFRRRGDEGMTDEEVLKHFGWKDSSARPRRWSLSDQRHFVEVKLGPDGKSVKRRNEAGNLMQVYVVTALGRLRDVL